MIKKILNDLFSACSKLVSFLYHSALNKVCSFLPVNNEIILESHPDLACNTWALFQYMLRKGLNEKLKLTWMVGDVLKHAKRFKDINNVSFIEIEPHSRLGKFKKYVRCYRARCIITSNRIVSKKNVGAKQLNIYLNHATPIKSVKEIYSKAGFDCDYLVSQGPLFTDMLMDQYNLKKEQVLCLGFPRNDILFSGVKSIDRVYSDIKSFKKVIIWAPTFREHKNKMRVDVDSHFPLGIPIVYQQTDVLQLNEFLIQNNVLIIIKPHPAQDLTVLKDFKATNIRFLYNEDLERNDIQTNELLSQTNALITDYSSIYWDYLLVDKPIGITLDDYEQYKAQHGFTFKEPLKWLVGKRIYNLNDLLIFVENVCKNIDPMKKRREELKEKTQIEPANESTKRVYDFIISKLKID